LRHPRDPRRQRSAKSLRTASGRVFARRRKTVQNQFWTPTEGASLEHLSDPVAVRGSPRPAPHPAEQGRVVGFGVGRRATRRRHERGPRSQGAGKPDRRTGLAAPRVGGWPRPTPIGARARRSGHVGGSEAGDVLPAVAVVVPGDGLEVLGAVVAGTAEADG
jgi:hypothetical protein